MKIRRGDTELFHDRITRCEDVDELRAILNRNSDYYNDWKGFINAVVEVNKLSYEKLARLCSCSKNTVKGWCREGKLPQNREAFIKIALGLGLNLEQTNDLLQRYGRYPKLYAKNMEDAMLIFVINHPDYSRDPYEYYRQLKEDCLRLLREHKSLEANPEHEGISTQYLHNEILSTDTRNEFEELVIQNSEAFESSYDKLLNYIDLFITSRNDNIHEFVKYKNLSSVFEKVLSNLKNHGEVPNRTKLIALGIHLNMSLDQLNEMLNLAGMENVCAKDRVECAVIYAVESAYLNNPGFAYENALCLKNYVHNKEIQKQCRNIIKEYMDTKTYEHIGDFKEYGSMEDEISEYLKWVLEEIELDNSEIYELL